MSSEWSYVEIGSICEAIYDGPHATPKKTSEGPIFLGISALNHGRLDLSSVEHLSEEDFIKWTKRVTPQEGDLVFSYETRLGEVAMIPAAFRGCLGRRMALMRIDKKKALPEYILYAYLSPTFQEVIRARTVHGSTVDRIPLTEFGSFPIHLPPLNVQRGIAATLKAIDGRIALLHETNATLESIAQALFKSWFVDFDPVRAKMEGRQPEGMDEATAVLFPDSFEESELGLVPRGWHVDLLESWLRVLETGRRPKGGVSGIETGVPSIGAESIIRMGGFDYGKTKYVSQEFFQKMKSGALESRDVLLYKDGGKPGVFLPRVSMFGDGFPFKTCGINEHVFRIRLKEPFGQTFLYFWLWSDAVMHELKHRGGKAAIPGINQADVKELKIAVPNEGILAKYEELTSSLVSTVFNNAKKIQTLATLRNTLLPRLISGQLRIPEAEKLATH